MLGSLTNGSLISSGWSRESISLPFPVSRGWLHSLAHDPIPLSSKSAAWHLWIFLLFWHFCFPLARTLTITLGPPGYSRIVSSSQGPHLNHTCKSLFTVALFYWPRRVPLILKRRWLHRWASRGWRRILPTIGMLLEWEPFGRCCWLPAQYLVPPFFLINKTLVLFRRQRHV